MRVCYDLSMTDATPDLTTLTPATEPDTAASATPWIVALVTIAIGLALFIFLTLIATQAGAPSA